MLSTNISAAPRMHTAGRQKAPAFGEGIILNSYKSFVTSDVTRMPVFALEFDERTVEATIVGNPAKGTNTLVGENGKYFSYEEDLNSRSKEYKDRLNTLKDATEYLDNKLNHKVQRESLFD